MFLFSKFSDISELMSRLQCSLCTKKIKKNNENEVDLIYFNTFIFKREKECSHPLVCSLLKWLGFSRLQARSWELNPGHPGGWQEPKYLSHHLYYWKSEIGH